MFRIIFRNPWFAAIWVLATLASAAAFVSKDGGQAMIGQARDRIRERSQQRVNLESPEPTRDATVVDAAPAAEPAAESALVESAAMETAPDAGDTYVVVDKLAAESTPAGETF